MDSADVTQTSAPLLTDIFHGADFAAIGVARSHLGRSFRGTLLDSPAHVSGG